MKGLETHCRGILGAIVFLLAATLVALASSSTFADTKRKFVTIGSGQIGGVYYPVAQSICREINLTMGGQGYYCSAEATPGSRYNLQALARGEIDFALVQADSHYQAARGEGEWDGRPMSDLRSIMSFYSETFTILARADSGITGLDSLRGKRINVGSPGSGSRITWDEVAFALGFQDSDFAHVSELRPDAAAELLCSNELDASLQVTGHPSESIKRQLEACGLIIVPAAGPEIEKLVADRPYFVPTVVPGAVYGLSSDIPSFGGRAALITTAIATDADVLSITKAIVSRFEELRATQPNLSSLNLQDAIRLSLTAPLHDGAKRAYQELGLLPE